MSHEFSTLMVKAMWRSAQALGFASDFESGISDGARAALEKGGFLNYIPGVDADELLLRVMQVRGTVGAETLMQHVTATALEGSVAPIARLYLSFGGRTPTSVLNRFDDLLKGTTREIHTRWFQKTTCSGHLTVDYPILVDPRLAHGWCGALRHLLVFCEFQGEVRVRKCEIAQVEQVILDVSWVEQPPR